MNYYMSEEKQDKIKALYLSGHSAQEIVAEMNLGVSLRTLQRWLKRWGIIRSAGDAFRLAVARGKVPYYYSPNKIVRKGLRPKYRRMVLERDSYKCVLCGNGANDSRIQVDHIDNDPTNNVLDNLQTLCEHCNQGKKANVSSL